MGESISLNCSMKNRYEIAWYHLTSEQQLDLLISAEKDNKGRVLLTNYNPNSIRLKLTADTWVTRATLEISGVIESDSGLYFCGTKSDAPEMLFDKHIRLEIEGAASLPVTGQKGGTITLPCFLSNREDFTTVLRFGPKTQSKKTQYEISVNFGEELKLDVLLPNADKVQHQGTRSTGWKEDWSRTDGVQSERITFKDGKLIISHFTSRDRGSYRVLDPDEELLITIKIRDFVRFVSFRAIYHNLSGAAPLCRDSVPWSVALRDGVVLKAVAVDVFLLVLFSLQHSLLAWTPVKQVCQNVFGVLTRTVYCFTTAAALQILMHYWHPVTSAPCLWSVRNAPWDIWFPLICFILHFLCWAIICSILLIFDYPELLGIKQVYYECLGLGDPLLLKSERAQRLYSHLRHPVFVELLTVLWVLPTFPLDRLLLAVYLSVYLILAHSLDNQDCAYLRRQLRSKLQLFSSPLEDNDQSNNNMHKQD
ncbi:nurim [Labeo rohita]|uniref:Nurim n=1 Tax=Labeo rohita TaxID=84645 RepID=A0A498M7V8_LABRO|nr:nurim [Labeo rohita]